VYVDKTGVLRYTKDNKEAAFFGVNYTIPFAYGYRSHKALGIDPEKAIDADVYHMARLGLDAFRVHVWDVEISDSTGKLLENEHLRLFDYLLKKLKEHNIKILITPIAFWGNGYPEPDVKTNGFSYVYGKGPSVVKEEAFKAQENYLKQFFTHVNPYTKLSYKDDPDVIAVEINNEPHHSGPKERTTEYVNRMAAAVKSVGWTKPIFYNISESPSYADAVVKANVDGHSFQWYPTSLVAGPRAERKFFTER
jgi:endo-1,4-beta-mannosidase